MKYTINQNNVVLEKVGKPKKITGTRLGAILGLNVWSTPFEAWCDMTKLYKEPFEDTIYTIAGKVIEPKILKYLNDEVYAGRVVDPETHFGKDYQKMRFDFYPQEQIFGGMWDALIINKVSGKSRAIIEVKTTKRAEDWANDVPLYYKIQAMLYAKLEGVKTFIFAVAFLDDAIYENPEAFVANSETVKVFEYELDDEYINEQMGHALKWHEAHVVSGVSPTFDEKKDADILKELRTNRIESTSTLDEYLTILDTKKPLLEEKMAEIADLVKEVESAEDAIKAELVTRFTDQDNTVSITTSLYEFKVNRSVKESDVFDEKKFAKDNPELHKQYLKKQAKETVRKQVVLKAVVNE